MRRSTRLFLAGWVILTVAGCAGAQPGTPLQADGSAAGRRQCFNAASVNGFKVVDDLTVDLTLGARQAYRVTLLGTCPEVEDAVGVAVRTRSGSGFVCENEDVELIVPSQTGPRFCPATSIVRRTTAELDAERAARGR